MYKKLILITLCMFTLNSCITASVGIATAIGVGASKRETFKGIISDAKISSVIKVRFIDKGFDELYKKIGVQVLFGRVFLIGYVGSEQDVDTAINVVWDTEGVVDVTNEIKVSDKSNYFHTAQYLTDTYITSAVKTKLFGKKDIKSFTFTVITQDNIVYLFGMVDSQEKLEEVSQIASYVKGVETVKSHIIVKK